MSQPTPKVLLTSTTNAFEARVIQARLASEGLDAELRGAVDSPYPLTVSDLGRVAVYVPPDQLDDARLVLLADEIDASVGEAAPAASEPLSLRRGNVVAVAVVVLLVLVLMLARVLRAGITT